MKNTFIKIIVWFLKLAVICYLILTFVEAHISVQLVLIYLVTMLTDKISEISALEEKTDIQKERIDELECEIDRLKK